jgi:hypothetical protein
MGDSSGGSGSSVVAVAAAAAPRTRTEDRLGTSGTAAGIDVVPGSGEGEECGGLQLSCRNDLLKPETPASTSSSFVSSIAVGFFREGLGAVVSEGEPEVVGVGSGAGVAKSGDSGVASRSSSRQKKRKRKGGHRKSHKRRRGKWG